MRRPTVDNMSDIFLKLSVLFLISGCVSAVVYAKTNSTASFAAIFVSLLSSSFFIMISIFFMLLNEDNLDDDNLENILEQKKNPLSRNRKLSNTFSLCREGERREGERREGERREGEECDDECEINCDIEGEDTNLKLSAGR